MFFFWNHFAVQIASWKCFETTRTNSSSSNLWWINKLTIRGIICRVGTVCSTGHRRKQTSRWAGNIKRGGTEIWSTNSSWGTAWRFHRAFCDRGNTAKRNWSSRELWGNSGGSDDAADPFAQVVSFFFTNYLLCFW